MRLRIGGTSLDTREWGLNTITLTDNVRTGELPLTDGTFYTQALGVSARQFEIGGEFQADNAVALAGWTQILAWAQDQEQVEVAQYLGGTPGVLGRFYITGQPRINYVELLNGEPVAYRWRLRLISASA